MFFEGKYAKLGAAGFLEAVLSRLVCGGPLASLVERLLMRELDIFHDSARKKYKKNLLFTLKIFRVTNSRKSFRQLPIRI